MDNYYTVRYTVVTTGYRPMAMQKTTSYSTTKTNLYPTETTLLNTTPTEIRCVAKEKGNYIRYVGTVTDLQ